MSNKILVPVNDDKFLPAYVEAGASEFYIGFYDNSYFAKHGEYSEINRMSGFREYANKNNFPQCLEVVKKIKELNSSAFVTINAATYSEAQLGDLERYFEDLARVGADGVIVSIPELITLAHKYKLQAVASTMCGIYNTDIADFYKSLGMTRMILPRDLSIREINDIVLADNSIEYEVFLMRNGCRFSDSHCLGTHRPEQGGMCHMLNTVNCNIVAYDNEFEFEHNTELNNLLYKKFFHMSASCGLCALYQFVKMNIAAYKIVGRADNQEGILNDIRLVKKNIEIAESCASQDEFFEKMLKIPNSYEGCKLGLGCYYPEIRF